MKSQNEQVLNYMKTHEGITTLDAFRKLGITRLSARIYELRDKGHIIDSVDRTTKDRNGKVVARFTEYKLGK